MTLRTWRSAVAAGATWALVYNLVWGGAWYLFMRAEWTAATAAVHRDMPWTSGAWHAWVLATVPLGIGIMGYAQERPSPYRGALVSGVVIGMFFQVALAVYARSEGLAWRVILLDSGVSLSAVCAAGLAGAWVRGGSAGASAHAA